MLVDKIKALCCQSGISLCELEKRLGFGNGLIRRWETSSPSITNIQKVAHYFHVSIEYFVEENPLSQEALEIAYQYEQMSSRQKALVKCYLSVIQ